MNPLFKMVAFAALFAVAGVEGAKPNIIAIMADDMGCDGASIREE